MTGTNGRGLPARAVDTKAQPPRRALAGLLWLLADLVEADERGRSFRGAAYRRATWALDELPPDLEASEEELRAIRGIGPGIVSLIGEFRETGNVRQVLSLQQAYPAEAHLLRRLPRMTPKRMRLLRSQYEVENRSDLRTLLETTGVADIPGVGPHTERLWLEILRLPPSADSVPAQKVWSQATSLARHIAEHTGSWVDIAGGVRRSEEWATSIDLVAVSEDDSRLKGFLAGTAAFRCSSPSSGVHTARLHSGLPVRIHSSVPEAAGTTLFRATGPPEHVADVDMKPFPTEYEGYRSVGLPLIPPAARGLALDTAARVVTVDDIRGDLHVHSDASPDGHMSLDDIARIAVASRYAYILITDHSKGLRFGGLGELGIREQAEAIARLRDRFPSLVVFHGAELNIAPDGALDLDAGALACLDFAVAGVHSHFHLDRAEQTKRVLTALTNPVIRVLAHPFGRRIGIRPALDIDMERVIEACRDQGVAMESNGHRDRLDLPASWIRRAADSGALFAANSDAHRATDLANIDTAVATLQRAGVRSDQVVNSFSLARFRDWLETTHQSMSAHR